MYGLEDGVRLCQWVERVVVDIRVSRRRREIDIYGRDLGLCRPVFEVVEEFDAAEPSDLEPVKSA
ncbi:hypothetical protein [Natronolimnohabitans innermongolicus]|uniref:Uncharacterized protein n=1 Tax=Natronolimnohabitans innermongolicus JCM 12255 TaxID=1227499 RepID=L9WZB0_9EURY|nr:hypothetical protein [Natronolimnohabitans innermongolicus]ELY54491.1 hypothetical protein C493_12539 [Natronolimnohabitans innermongolicus JCM 12255]